MDRTAQVKALKAKYPDWSQRQIADNLGVSRSTVAYHLAKDATPAQQGTSTKVNKGTGVTFIGRDGRVSNLKSTGNPWLDVFYGINNTDALRDTNDGYGTAFDINTVVYRGVMARAQNIAQIPLEIVRNPRSNDEHIVDDIKHPLFDLFVVNGSKTMKFIELDRAIFGVAYLTPRRGWRSNDSIYLKRFNPRLVDIRTDAQGISGFTVRAEQSGEVDHIDLDDMVFMPMYDPLDDLGFRSPVAVCLQAIQGDTSQWEFVKRFFENDATPNLAITTDQTLQPADVDRVRDNWRDSFGGVVNSHSPAVLHKGLNIQQLGSSMKDLIIPELDERLMRRISMALGVPLTIMLATDSANFATAEVQQRSFYTETLLPELNEILHEINTQLLPLLGFEDYAIRAKTDDISILQDDMNQVALRWRLLYQAGVVSLNQARRELNLEPLPDIDYWRFEGRLLSDKDILSGDAVDIVNQPGGGLSPFGSAMDSPFANPSLMTKAVSEQALGDLERWQRKAANKGIKSAFTSDYIPHSIKWFIRAELDRLPPSVSDDDIEQVFAPFKAMLKQADNGDFASVEEFDSYWRNLPNTYTTMREELAALLASMREAIADSIRRDAYELELGTILSAYERKMRDLLAPDDDTGQLEEIFLAGAARANESTVPVNPAATIKQAGGATGIEVAFDIVNEAAKEEAQQLASQQMQFVNNTTESRLSSFVQDWIQRGGSLQDLASIIEGLPMDDITLTDELSVNKIQWLFSPERAALIAQTTATDVYNRGVRKMWQANGIEQIRWRTAQDERVCPLCASLNNRVGALNEGVQGDDGRYYQPAAHPGCRCFVAIADETIL